MIPGTSGKETLKRLKNEYLNTKNPFSLLSLPRLLVSFRELGAEGRKGESLPGDAGLLTEGGCGVHAQ